MTADQGQTWQTAQLPEGVHAVVSVSCGDTMDCYAVAILGGTHGDFSFGLLSNAGG
jgi:hypothetical protein